MQSVLVLTLLARLLGVSQAEAVVVRGYPMDNYCINRGTLLDASSYRTLENPEQHSFYCLTEVAVCVDSLYAVLVKEDESDPEYTVAWQLDEDGTDAVIDALKRRGYSGNNKVPQLTFAGEPDSEDNTTLTCVAILDDDVTSYSGDICEYSGHSFESRSTMFTLCIAISALITQLL